MHGVIAVMVVLYISINALKHDLFFTCMVSYSLIIGRLMTVSVV